MKPEYRAWIAKHTAGKVVSGLCRSYAEEMRQAFPELILCRGYYTSPVDGSPAHWWLKTADGQIVDPTVSQFKMGEEGCYEEYDLELHGPLPIGKCMNCGTFIYDGDGAPATCCCSAVCERELSA